MSHDKIRNRNRHQQRESREQRLLFGAPDLQAMEQVWWCILDTIDIKIPERSVGAPRSESVLPKLDDPVCEKNQL